MTSTVTIVGNLTLCGRRMVESVGADTPSRADIAKEATTARSAGA